MPQRAHSFGLMMSGAACAVLAVVAVGTDSSAQAECVTQPTQQAPEGAHWSLHTDHVKNRRCWILVDAAGRDFSTPPQEEEQSAASSALSTLQTFIGNLTGGGPSSPPAQEAPAAVPQVPAGPPPHPRRAANANRPEQAVRTEQRDKGDARAGRQGLSGPERDALFEEFLRWHQSQQMLGTGNNNQPR